MKRLWMQAACVAVAAVAPLAAQADTTKWEFDPMHSAAEFSVKHMMVSNVRGQFSNISGTVELDEKHPAKSTVEATIDASTVDTRVPQRDGHLKSPDFFDVAKFPTMTFKSTKITSSGKGHYKVTGDLTLHGVTKPVVLDVESPDTELTDPMGNVKRGITATTKIHREDFGLVWNKTLEKGGVLVGSDVNVTIDGELKKAAAVTATQAGSK